MTMRPARLRRSRLVSATRPILGSEFPEQVDDLPLVGHFHDVHVINPVMKCGSNASRSLVSIEDNDLGVYIGTHVLGMRVQDQIHGRHVGQLRLSVDARKVCTT